MLWEIILCLIVIKDTLLCVTGYSIFQTYFGRAVNAAALFFLVFWLCSRQRPYVSGWKGKIAAGILFYFGLLTAVSILVHHTVSDAVSPYYLILLLGFILWDMDQRQYERFLRDFRWFLSAYILLSLVLLLFGYGKWEKSFQSFIPFIDFRLMGITAQPNGLGFMASVCLGMFWRENKLVTGLAFVTLLLTQSKTAIMGLAAWYMVLCIFKFKECRRWSQVLFIAALLLINAGIILVTAAGLVSDAGFTGRVGLWRYGFAQWSSSLTSIWLGAGENVLTAYPIFYAKQAHNQFLNNLFGAGIVGFAAVLLLSACICRWIALDFKYKKTASAFLGVVILVRCLMECPFYSLSIGNFGVIILAWLTMQVYDLKQIKTKGREMFYENRIAGSGYGQ